MTSALSTIGKVATIPAAFLGITIFAILFGGVLAIVLYIFKSIGIYTISKRRGVKAPGLGWIPILDQFTLGRTCDDIRRKSGAKHSGFGGWILVLELIELASGIAIVVLTGKTVAATFGDALQNAITYTSWLLPLLIFDAICAVVLVILELIVLAFVYKSLSGAHVALFLLSFFFAFLTPIFLFAIRKNDRRDDKYEDYYTE